MRNHAPSKPLLGCKILLIRGLDWGICIKGQERLGIIVKLIPIHIKMQSKSTQKLLYRKNNRPGRISVGKLMAYNHNYESAFGLPSGAFTSTDQEVPKHILETHFLDLKASFRLRFTPFWLVPTTVSGNV
jgi:hypothetical protein